MKRSKHTAGYFAAFSLMNSFLELMSRKKITKAKLAEMTGESRPTVSKWFSPGRNLTVFTAAAIAQALGAELRISVVEKTAKTDAERDESLWGSGTLPGPQERVRVANDEVVLRHATSDEGVSAAVLTRRFVVVNRGVRGAADTARECHG